ncbi:MAG: MFS transporter [Planctomycetaceae bacterium]|jgi:MFS family permease|nr:MFS transporter [Planctomycetaceae bacterium]MBT4846088.1 MFS transporter [Planctomycetaceae bacterium]MBT6849045.1 MFS transporter [Planctomycetaceae bacterium]MBT7916143.1 MFS transporter [Planctomycetaceae bacterium]
MSTNTNSPTTPGKLYDRSFALAFICNLLFVPANTLLVHYAQWIDYLRKDEPDLALIDLGYITSSGLIISFLARPWLGQMVNRFGSKNMWMVGYVFFLVGFLSNLFITDVNAFLYISRGIICLGVACVFTSSITYITVTTPADRRTEAIGVLGISGFFGFVIGPLLGDCILGTQPTAEDFRLFFWTGSGSILTSMAILLFMPATSGNRVKGTLSLRRFLTTVKKYWPGSIIYVNAAFGLCMTVPLHLLKKFILDKELTAPVFGTVGFITIFYIIYAGWGITIRLLVKSAPDRIGRRKVLLVGIVAMVVGYIGFCFITENRLWALIIPAFCCGTGHGLTYHCMTSLTLESFPAKHRGTGTALAMMAFDCSAVVGMPIIAWIIVVAGYNAMFLGIAATVTLVAGIFFYQHGVR